MEKGECSSVVLLGLSEEELHCRQNDHVTKFYTNETQFPLNELLKLNKVKLNWVNDHKRLAVQLFL